VKLGIDSTPRHRVLKKDRNVELEGHLVDLLHQNPYIIQIESKLDCALGLSRRHDTLNHETANRNTLFSYHPDNRINVIPVLWSGVRTYPYRLSSRANTLQILYQFILVQINSAVLSIAGKKKAESL
jgi:hypothetical protein